MAGITGGFPFKTFLVRNSSSSSASHTQLQQYVSSIDSKLFGLRLRGCVSASSVKDCVNVRSVVMRYGGGGGGGGSRGSYGGPRPPAPTDEDDRALDISSIKSATVRLIDAEQNMVGLVSKSEAIRMAEDVELDLVILSPDADPPVVRLMDYSKYRYELQKRKRDQQKKSLASRMDLKELKMGYRIDTHDYDVRLRAAKRFLADGDKVKIIVNLKGRDVEFRNIAIELLRKFQADIGELGTEESKNFKDKNLFIVLIPNKATIQKAQDAPKKKEKQEIPEVSAGVKSQT
uniref:Translation initiation factor IF-3 n=1 Tax=Kalanchoe fedtschenkoi TaxID=63787 RepID=A0A7N0V638_KALFE